MRDDDDDFIDVLVRATDDEEVETIAMSYRDRIFNQGREEGREAGRAEGRKEGEKAGREEGARGLLVKQLQLKGGGLDPAVEARLSRASLAELEGWSERVLTAETVDAVFETQLSPGADRPRSKVRMRFGSSDVEALVLEHRGPLGVGGQELLRVRFQYEDANEPIDTEVPVDAVTPIDTAA